MIGSVIGTYRIVDRLGTGGMGTVYRGVDILLGRPVAIKALKPELVANPQLIERFRTEAVLLAKLNHPNIATLYGFLPLGNGQFAMAMEFLPGTPLDELLRQQGAMSAPAAAALFSGVLDAIGYAHRQGIIHRDLKPSNVMVLPDGTPKVMDFGIARAVGSAHQTRVGAIVGTLEYMSPEQIQGRETDARSDIYSLGIMLYEMLTGRVPFAADSEYALLQAHIHAPPPPPRVFAPDVPEAVAQVVLHALEKDPDRRFQTAAEFKLALAAATTPSLARIPGDRQAAVSLPGAPGGWPAPSYPAPESPAVSAPCPTPPLPPGIGQAPPTSRLTALATWTLASSAAVAFLSAVAAYMWAHRGTAPLPSDRAPASSHPPAREASSPIVPPAASVPTASEAHQPVLPETERADVLPPPRPPAVSIPETAPPRINPPAAPPEQPISPEGAKPTKRPRRPGKEREALSERERRRREALKALDQ